MTNSGRRVPVDGADGRRGRPASQHNKRNNVVEGQLEMIFMPMVVSAESGRTQGNKRGNTSTDTRKNRRARYKGRARQGEAGPGRA